MVVFVVDKVALGQVVFSSSAFPSISFHHGSPCSYIIWGINNRPVHGCSSETSSHPAYMNSNILPPSSGLR
jgi:hypothetical protein